MKVYELIQKLQQMNQWADVECYAGYDPEHGDCWNDDLTVEQEASGWDEVENELMVTVFIK